MFLGMCECYIISIYNILLSISIQMEFWMDAAKRSGNCFGFECDKYIVSDSIVINL